MWQKRQRWQERLRDDENGMSLIEILVSIVIIVIVLVATSRVLIDTFGIQQDVEAQSNATQIARDYIERSQQATYASLGFYSTDDGRRSHGHLRHPDTNAQEPTVIVPDSRIRSSLNPLDTRIVGGVVYNVRIDITSTNPSYEYAPKRITVIVSWIDSKNNTKDVTMSVVRTPSASEQIPPALDLTGSEAPNGAPSSPTYYDEVNQYAGTSSNVFGREFAVKVAHAGTSSVHNLIFRVYCNGDITSSPVVINWNSPPSGWSRSVSNHTYYLGYYGDSPSNISCHINTATTQVVAVNNAGASAPITILPANFMTY